MSIFTPSEPLVVPCRSPPSGAACRSLPLFDWPDVLWVGTVEVLGWLSVRPLVILGLQAQKLFSHFDMSYIAYLPSVPSFFGPGVGTSTPNPDTPFLHWSGWASATSTSNIKHHSSERVVHFRGACRSPTRSLSLCCAVPRCALCAGTR